ncbi:MAG: hypothetical protein ACRDRJ_16380 [Streptosporangiaceae bacterium]
MTAAPVLKAAAGGLTRRLVQTLVIVMVLAVATSAATLGLALLTNANEAFTSAFTSHHGADISITVNTSHVTDAQLAATRHVAGVTKLGGPYPELTVTYTRSAPAARGRRGSQPRGGPGSRPRGGSYGPGPHDDTGGPSGGTSQLTLVGRPSPGGSLDDLTVN